MVDLGPIVDDHLAGLPISAKKLLVVVFAKGKVTSVGKPVVAVDWNTKLVAL